MLINANKTQYRFSTSKHFGVSSGSSRVSEEELTKPNETEPEVIFSDTAPEIQAAQKLIARIAVRILTERKQKRNEQQAYESEPSSDKS